MRLLLYRGIIGSVVLFTLSFAVSAQTGLLKGKVKLQGSKTHEAVTVSAQRYKGTKAVAEPIEVQTNDKGEYLFEKLPVGAYVLNFVKTGYQSFTTRQQEVVSGETLQIKEFTMTKEGEAFADIRGAVFYGGGFTLPNALVTIERIDGVKKFKQEKYSQDGGEFGFHVKAEKAKYRVTAQARGYQSASIEIEIESDELRNIALTLQPLQ